MCAASAASGGPGPGAAGSWPSARAQRARSCSARRHRFSADADQPRPEAIGIAQPLEPDEGRDDGLLRGVGGELGVGGGPPAGGDEQPVVALDERREGAAIPAAGSGDEVGIGWVATGHTGVCT